MRNNQINLGSGLGETWKDELIQGFGGIKEFSEMNLGYEAFMLLSFTTILESIEKRFPVTKHMLDVLFDVAKRRLENWSESYPDS